MPSDRVLDVRGLTVEYGTDAGSVVAVDDVDIDVGPGEFVGVVGESGCGKSTLLFAIARLLSPPAAITAGTVDFRGDNLATMSEKELNVLRWRDLSVVMQSAMNALNPVKSIGAQFRDTLVAHGKAKAEIQDRSVEVLKLVGIDPIHLRSYPHQLSGGMRQRAMIAMALLFTPELVIMDEPTSALDVVAQRSLMVQIKELQERLGFAVLFVTHDMSLVSHFSDRLVVMYAGQVVESGPTRTVFDEPAHPVQPRAARRVPVHPRPAGAPHRHPRTPARAAQSAVGLPVPSALPGRDGALQGDRARPLPGRTLAGALPQARAGRRHRRGRDMTTPLLEARGLTKHFKVGGNLSRKSPARRRRRRTSSSTRARSSRWSARAAAARARSRGCSPGCTSRPAARSCTRASRCGRCAPAGRRWPIAATSRWCSRIRSAR